MHTGAVFDLGYIIYFREIKHKYIFRTFTRVLQVQVYFTGPETKVRLFLYQWSISQTYGYNGPVPRHNTQQNP